MNKALSREELIKAIIKILNLIIINILDISLAFFADSSISSESGTTKDLTGMLLKKLFKKIKINRKIRVMMKKVTVNN
jgi:hypothetical protein